mmetsp:Transcript_5983/g.10641  ORF Transcript_5983/g.10641 Transcript_5983/m.10641 type:complete len:91 (-) Transcript_5983:938-1210(-)
MIRVAKVAESDMEVRIYSSTSYCPYDASTEDPRITWAIESPMFSTDLKAPSMSGSMEISESSAMYDINVTGTNANEAPNNTAKIHRGCDK